VDAYNQCTGDNVNISSLFTDWWSSNTAVAEVATQQVTSVSPGFADAEASGLVFVCQDNTGVWVKEYPVAPVTVATIAITNADLEDNFVDVTLQGPSSATGTLVVTANGSSNKVQASANGGAAVGPGSYQVAFDRPSMPPDTYTTLTAQWNLSPTPISTSFTLTRQWSVLGLIRHSQYNTPTESACTGSPQTAWVFTTSCNFTQVALKTDFVSQTYRNGSGKSLSYGDLQYNSGKTCSGKYPSGANTQNSFLEVANIAGSCGTPVVGGTSVATYPNPAVAGGPFVCQDNVLLVTSANANQAIKQVADYCPACSGQFNGTNGHIDDYTSSSSCSAHSVGDYGNFWTADTH
jgi:hypothetical protein